MCLFGEISPKEDVRTKKTWAAFMLVNDPNI